MKKLPFICWLTGLWFGANAQQTAGTQGPIIKGAKAKVNYVTKQTRQFKIPDGIATYITGLILENKINSDTASIGKALQVWLRKYNELRNGIEKQSNANLRASLLVQLNRGDFSSVEKALPVKTSYKDLFSVFPATYATTGDQSPIIIGDYATISYVVNEVISYELPEGVTANILNDLKTKNRKISSLQENLQNNEQLVAQWIQQYRKLEALLKNSTSETYKKAYEFFKENKLNEALKQLDAGSINDKEFAESRLLKARILLLQLSFASIDSSMQQINNAYSIAIQLMPTTDNVYEYAKFLIDNMGNVQPAIPLLEKILPDITGTLKKVEVLNYLALSYSYLDKIKASDYWEKALQELQAAQPLHDSDLLEKKALVLSNISGSYLAAINPALIQSAINYTNQALETLQTIQPFTERYRFFESLLYNQKGRGYAMLGDTVQAMKNYHLALYFLEPATQRKPSNYTIPLVTVYANIAELHSNAGRFIQAIFYLDKNRQLVEPHVNLNARVHLNALEIIYTGIVRNYVALNQPDSVLKYLRKFNESITPFVAMDPKTFLFHKAAVYTDLGNLFVYLNQPGQIDSAAVYLKWASDFYIRNLNMVQFDRQKVSTCFMAWNAVLIRQQKITEAVNYNRILLEKITITTQLSIINYQDFIPQVYSQLAEVYLNQPNLDSAFKYSSQALNILRPRARQFSTLYMAQYLQYMGQACKVSLYSKAFARADSLVDDYFSYCSDICNIDPNVKDNLKGQLGDNIAGLANLFIQYANDPGTDQSKWTDIFEMAEKHVLQADKFYKEAYLKNNQEAFRYAAFLKARANFEYQWWQRSLTTVAKRVHRDKKCKYAQQSRQLLENLPPTVNSERLLQELKNLAIDCAP